MGSNSSRSSSPNGKRFDPSRSAADVANTIEVERQTGAIRDEAAKDKLEKDQIKAKQRSLLEAERAKRSSISTSTKRNTIRTGAQGISPSKQMMPSTIAGGSGLPNSGISTIVGG
jgi:hypothetical protein